MYSRSTRSHHQTLLSVPCAMTNCQSHTQTQHFTKDTPRSLPYILAEGESQDRATCCNLLPPLFSTCGCGALADDDVSQQCNVGVCCVGGESESIASLIFPLGAQQQAGKS